MNIDYAYELAEAVRISAASGLAVGPDTASAIYTGARPLPCLDFDLPPGIAGPAIKAMQTQIGLLTTDLLDHRALLPSGTQVFFRQPIRGAAAVHEWVEWNTLTHVSAIDLAPSLPKKLLMPTLQSVTADKLKLLVGRAYSHDFFDVTSLAANLSADQFIDAIRAWTDTDPTKRFDNLERLLFILRNPQHHPEAGPPVVLDWCTSFWPTIREDCETLSGIVSDEMQLMRGEEVA